MKKRLLFVAAIVAASTTFAQDGLTSKKGEAYLPEAGDWSISIDANPILNYGGNLLNGTAGQTFGGANWTNASQAITGKMFKDENTAYRAMVRIGFSSATTGTVNKWKSNPSDVDTQEFTDEVKAKLATLGYDATYGARPLASVFNRLIVRPLSKKVLAGSLEDKKLSFKLENDEITLVG